MKNLIALLVVLLASVGTLSAEEVGEPHHDGAVTGVQEVHAEEESVPETQWWFVGLMTLQTVFLAWLASRHLYVRTNGSYKLAFTALQIFSAFLLYGTLVAQFWVHGDPSGK